MKGPVVDEVTGPGRRDPCDRQGAIDSCPVQAISGKDRGQAVGPAGMTRFDNGFCLC